MQKTNMPYFTKTFLDKMRQIGDPVADMLVKELIEMSDRKLLSDILAQIQKNSDKIPVDAPVSLQKYFAENKKLPAWADKEKMKLGAIFFKKYAGSLLSMLGFLSLPYCYAAADGARVLFFSERIRNDTKRRLTETAQFVVDIMQENAFEAEGVGFVGILKVRLMHAFARYYVSKNKDWNFEWGLPVNQEDMAGTNGAFSWISIRGLKKVGHTIHTAESEAFLHLWNVIGYLLGVREELLPQNGKEAFWFDKIISERHFKKSEAGIELTKALLECLRNESFQTMPKDFEVTYMRFLLGDTIADLLEIPESKNNRVAINFIKLYNSIKGVAGFQDHTIYKSIQNNLAKEKVSFNHF